jgi:hypothetical protein
MITSEVLWVYGWIIGRLIGSVVIEGLLAKLTDLMKAPNLLSAPLKLQNCSLTSDLEPKFTRIVSDLML